MKPRIGIFLFIFALTFCTAVIAAHGAQKTSDVDLVAREIRERIPFIRTVKDTEEHDAYLYLAALSLARLGKFESALEVSNAYTNISSRERTRDEIWRLTARRLAWLGNLPAAARCANRIQGKFSRADAILAVARAHQRTGDSGAALRVLQRISPDVLATQSPTAISYLAFLFVQNGDTTTARKLFARAIREAGKSDAEGQLDIVAYYQARCGWSEEALGNAENQPNNLSLTKAVLIRRRDWTLLRSFSKTLPHLQAVDFLLDLSGQQLQAKDRQAACESLEAAKARFKSLSVAEMNSKSAFLVQLRLALLEIANGEKEAGFRRFTILKTSPHFDMNWESAFYYSLIAPRHQAVLQLSSEQRSDFEQKAIALWQEQAKQPISWVPYNLLEIARAQYQRGALEAARQTLQLEHSNIRSEMVTSPSEQRQWTLTRAANRLLNLARARKEMKLDYRLPLAQLQTIWQSDSASVDLLGGIQPYSGAAKLIQAGFSNEAQKILESATFENIDAEAYGMLPSRAGTYARDKGVATALNWVKKLPENETRFLAVATVGALLTIRPKSEMVLTLRGANRETLKVGSQVDVSYDSLFDLRIFDLDAPIGN